MAIDAGTEHLPGDASDPQVADTRGYSAEVREFEAEYSLPETDSRLRRRIAANAATRGSPDFPGLEREYANLWAEMAIRRDRLPDVDSVINRIVGNKERYRAVERVTAVPWYAIATIHNLEASGNFSRHLHNGDPLTARTVHVPAGRPAAGRPPFTWEDSAADALAYHRFTQVTDWSVEHLAFLFERFNGWGYRLYHPHVKSPYLWSFSNHYTKGKYVADGRWSETAVSQQCGAMVLLRRLQEKGHIELDGARTESPQPISPTSREPEQGGAWPVQAQSTDAPAVATRDTNGIQDLRHSLATVLSALDRFDGSGIRELLPDLQPVLVRGSSGDAVGALQAMLRALQYFLEVDRLYGPATELAVKLFQRDHDLDVDGVVGPQVWDALERSTAAAQPRAAQRYWPLASGHIITSRFGPRPGGFHTGTDFGWPGGSAGKRVYAVQSGTVIFAGGAQGYGGPDPAGWLVIDSPQADGGGCVEYGHIVRKVAGGDRVIAGQLIAVINPNSQTNGGVAPHLHLSVMPREYDPRRKMDPIPWLGNASSPAD